jgi:uncharacterized protein (TIGR02231 family)
MRRPLLALLLLSGTAPAALAASLEPPSRVEAVTVYPDGAMVTRSVSVDLPAGASTVVLKGLAQTIDPASIRVQGEASQPLTIGSVETRLAPGDPRGGKDPEIERKLDALRADRDALGGRIEAQELKKAAIQRFAQAGPEKIGPEAKPLDIDKWSSAWDAVADGLGKVNEGLVDLRRRAKALDEEIAALERARSRGVPPGPAPRRDVTVALDAPGATSGKLTVTYRVAGAAWTPLYDARLDTGARDRKPSLDLVRRAQVVQRTGEDWSGVALTVSTIRASRGTAAPVVNPILVNLVDPAELAARAQASAAMDARKAEEGAVARRAAPMIAAAPPPVPAAEQVAQVESGAFQASFRVPGTVDVPADGSSRSFALSTRKLEPGLLAKAAPALDETAYLEVSFPNDEDVPLLPGEVSLHRDGTYVGRGRFALVAPGDKAELGFGADDRVKVTRIPLRRRDTDPSWIGNSRSEQREFRTTVKNLHDIPLRISVIDQLPVPENSSITVEPVNLTPPTEKSVADKRGVMGWTWDYAPGEQKEIRVGWRMKWPADRELVTNGPGPVPLHR